MRDRADDLGEAHLRRLVELLIALTVLTVAIGALITAYASTSTSSVTTLFQELSTRVELSESKRQPG